MTDNATSATTSTARSRVLALDTVAFEPPCFNASDRSSREACRAGTSPKSSVDNSESPSANRRTVVSIRTSSMRGRLAGDNATSPCTSMDASRRPASPATPARTQLSVSSCRTTRPRPAPSAARSAISRVRPAARASRRFAMLAQPMSHTTPTALISTHNVSWRLPVSRSCRGITATVFRRFSGYCRARLSPMVRICACARVRSTSGSSFPTAW